MSTPLAPEPLAHTSLSRPDPRLCSPKVALALALFPGLGQVYLGYPRRGLTQILIVGTLVSLLSANIRLMGMEPLLTLLLIFVILHNLIDAYRRAILINDALQSLETLPPQNGWGTFSPHGRLAAGLALIVGGTLTLLSLKFGISFAWLLEWWPAGFILLGGLLVAQAVKDRTAAEPQA